MEHMGIDGDFGEDCSLGSMLALLSATIWVDIPPRSPGRENYTLVVLSRRMNN